MDIQNHLKIGNVNKDKKKDFVFLLLDQIIVGNKLLIISIKLLKKFIHLILKLHHK
jgi:hypothetical protein